MITENDIQKEVQALNDVAGDYGRNYEYRMGKDNFIGLFDVHDGVYKPIYCSKTTAGFFAYVSLLKNIFKRGMIPDKNTE